MASRGCIVLRDIRRALEVCLPDCDWEQGEHNWHITPPQGRGLRKGFLPTGDHGSGNRAQIERGHVKKLARQFGILDCMKKQLRGL